MRALAMSEALGIMEGGDDIHREGIQESIETLAHYNADIVAEVSDENKNR
jgi:hypothetical protein